MITNYNNYINENKSSNNDLLKNMLNTLQEYISNNHLLDKIDMNYKLKNNNIIIYINWKIDENKIIRIAEIIQNYFNDFTFIDILKNKKRYDFSEETILLKLDFYLSGFENEYLYYDQDFYLCQINNGIIALDTEKYLTNLEEVLKSTNDKDIYLNLNTILHRIIDMTYGEINNILIQLHNKYKYILDANNFDLI